MALQSNESRLRHVQWTGNLVCAISIIENKNRLIKQIRGPAIVNCLSYCLGRYFISDWFLSSSKCHTPCIRERKGLTAEPASSSFSSVPRACQILERVKQESIGTWKETKWTFHALKLSCVFKRILMIKAVPQPEEPSTFLLRPVPSCRILAILKVRQKHIQLLQAEKCRTIHSNSS